MEPSGRTAAPPTRWYLGELVTLVALVAAVTAGAGLFFRGPILFTLGPVAGLFAALGTQRWARAALVAALGVVAGTAGASIASHPAWGPGLFWLPDALQAAVVAAVLGGLVSLALASSERLRPLISAVAVAAVIATMWFSAISLASIPAGDGQSNIAVLAHTPTYQRQMYDYQLYQIWTAELRAGKPYYPMAVSSIAAANAARPDAPLMIRSPFSYRLPTLYALLATLPQNGISFVIAMMCACSLGVVAAYVLARQFVSRPLALLAAIVVAAMFSGYGSPALLDTEAWAGVFALVSVATFVVARNRPSNARSLDLLSVAFALVAVAFRELALPFLVLGLAATLADPARRAVRDWIAWAIALTVAAAGLAAHWMAAASAFSAVVSRPIYASWFSPNGAGLVGAVRLFAFYAWLVVPVAWALVLLGIAGSALAPRDWPTRVMLAGAALGGPLVLTLVHPPGDTSYGTAAGYWGELVLPITLACVPLAFAWLTRLRGDSAD